MIGPKIATAVLVGLAAITAVITAVAMYKCNIMRVGNRDLRVLSTSKPLTVPDNRLDTRYADKYPDQHVTSTSMDGIQVNADEEIYTTRVFVQTSKPEFDVVIDHAKHASHDPIISVELLRAVVPSASYTVDSHNNTLNIECGGYSYEISVPIGMYNAATLIAALQNEIRASNATLFCNFTVEICQLRHTTKFKNSREFTLSFPELGSISYELGFESGAAISSEICCGTQTIKSPFRLDISAPRFLYVMSDRQLRGHTRHKDGVLAAIPLVTSLQYTDFSQDTMRRRVFSSVLRTQSLHFSLKRLASRRIAGRGTNARIRPRDMVPYNTNGLSIAFTLEITRVRPKHTRITWHSRESMHEKKA